MQEPIIEVKNLKKIYKIFDKPSDRVREALYPTKKRYSRDFYALNAITFNIKKGDTIGIVGGNGAGKSTLLKILTGVLDPTDGEILVKGKVAALLELGAGFNPDMTGIENIFLLGSIMGYSDKDIKKRLDSIVSFADIGEFINQPVKMYSSGMFARLAFSVNVAIEPDVLIVDEALSVGDDYFQQKCLAKMKQIQKNGTTILFVSHSIGTVLALCSKCIYLKKGTLVAYGDAKKVCTMYQNDTTQTITKELTEENLSTVDFDNNVDVDFHNDPCLKKRITERSGTMEVEVVGFDFLDANNRIIHEQVMFSPLRMHLSMVTRETIPEGAALGILCRNSLGIDVFAGNLNFYNVFLPKLERDSKFTIFLEFDVPLTQGTYYFGIGIKPDVYGTYFYDRCFNAAKLDILQKENMKYSIGGLVYASLKDFKISSVKGDLN